MVPIEVPEVDWEAERSVIRPFRGTNSQFLSMRPTPRLILRLDFLCDKFYS